MTRVAAAAENNQLARFRIQGDRAAKTVRRGDRPVHDPVEAVNTKLMQMHDDATAEQRRSKRAGRRFRGGGDEGDETLFHRRQQNVLFFARIPVDFVDEQHGFLTAALQPFGGRQRVTQLFDTRIDGGQLNENADATLLRLDAQSWSCPFPEDHTAGRRRGRPRIARLSGKPSDATVRPEREPGPGR